MRLCGASLMLVAFALAGCHSPEREEAAPLPVRGPAHTLRVALDPAFADATLARALLATPLRVDPGMNELRPGLCRTWTAARGGRVWTLRCSHAAAIAERLRGGLFAGVQRADGRGGMLVVRLAFAWRRFAWALTSPAAAPRNVPGPFRLVRRSRDRVVVARRGLTVVFRRLDPYAAVRAFRRGELDEAPVPQGEIRALEADGTLGEAVRARSLLGVDVVAFERRVPRSLRRVYWLTVPRGEYQALIAERVAPAAFGLLEDAEESSPAEVRRGRRSIGRVPRIPVRIGVSNRPELVEAAEIPWAEWRQLGLPVTLVPGGRGTNARFVRLIAAYPHPEGLLVALGIRPSVRLEEVDERLRRTALVVPLARVAEARLVSRRVRGWRMDTLGVVDYSRVRLAASA
jgi:hypothetical protein